MMSTVESLRPSLAATLEKLKLPTREPQLDALLGFLTLLLRWNAHYNLTSVRDPADMLRQHLADCLAVIGPLMRHVSDGTCRLLDVGSGGGLPGIVIAIMCPRVDVTCVDSVGKKTAFIQQTASELGLRNLHAQHSRVEHLQPGEFDVLASRAFSSLETLTLLTRPLLHEHGVWMAMKGKRPDAELAAVSNRVDVFHVEQLSVPGLNAERCLVWMRPVP